MRISIEGWKGVGRDLPNTVGKTSLFTKAIIEKYGQGDNYVFDPAMMVYLVKAEPQPEEEKKSPSEERAKEYVIREKEVLKLVTQQEKSREFLTRLTRTSMIPDGRELLKRKSFKQQFTIWIQNFIRDYQDYVQNIYSNTNVSGEGKAKIQKELVALSEMFELWKQTTSLKEDSYRKEIEKHVQQIRRERENLEKQEYMQKVQRIILQEMENIDTTLFSVEEGKELSELELDYLVKSSIMELEEEERQALYRELVDVKNVREGQHGLYEKQINKTIVKKYFEKLQSVYLEEILLRTLNRKEERRSLEETYLTQGRILTLKEWENENIFSVDKIAGQGEKTGRERRELYEKQVSRIVGKEEEEKVIQKLQTIREKEWEHRKRVQSAYLESTELKESLTEKLNEELFKSLVKRKKETRLEEENQPQSRILSFDEWEREIIHRVEENVVQEKKTENIEKTESSEKAEHELLCFIRNSLMELSEEERQELYRELVDIKSVRKERHERNDKQRNEIISQEEKILKKIQNVYIEKILLETLEQRGKTVTSDEVQLSQSRIFTLEELEREMIHRAEESVVQKTEQEEKTEQELRHIIKNSLMKLTEEERQELYQELVHIKEIHGEQRELYEKQKKRIVSQNEEEILRKLQSAEWEEVRLKTLQRKNELQKNEQEEKVEKVLHHLVRNSLMEMSKEERQDFYRKLITAEKAEEIEQVISHRIGMTQAQEQTLIREIQTVFLEEVKKKKILVEMPENQRSYMQTSLQFSNQEYAQTSNLERELIQSEENQTVQSETKNIERFYYNSNHMESIEKIRMEQREQLLNLQEISRQQGEQLEKMEIQQKELREKLERAKQNPYEQEQKVMQKLENQLRLEQLRRGLA